MIANQLKAKWAAGQATFNGWLAVGNSFTAEIMAEQGYDSLTIDLQHGFLDFSAAMGMLQAVRASGVTPMVRVPWLDAGMIMKVLDAGSYGVICPMVNTSEQASALVAATRYPPLGYRSFGPIRASLSGGAGYASAANDQVLALAMIETSEAVANVEAICAVPGLDGIYIGPADLTLGVTAGRLAAGFDRREPEMVDTIRRILDAAKRAGIRAGLHCGTPDYAVEAMGWGFDMTTVSSDSRLLASAASASLGRARALLEGRAEPKAGERSGESY